MVRELNGWRLRFPCVSHGATVVILTVVRLKSVCVRAPADPHTKRKATVGFFTSHLCLRVFFFFFWRAKYTAGATSSAKSCNID